ncbi:MAG: methyltransferase domain-containing protein [Silicimonas sp.]|nr:methyltransferase domain-containing protein [Silicimonas sp.]
MSELREDRFLDGRITLRQPARGYRAGADPVFLAASVDATPGERVLELGCGVGTALFCLGHRVPGLDLTGVERQADLADLARDNGRALGQKAEIITADLAALPGNLTAQSFDHVMFNPPFFDRSSGSASPDAQREGGRGGSEMLSFWIDAALRRTRPGGVVTMIHRIEALPEALASLDGRAGDIAVLPLAPRRARPAKLFLLRAKKAAKGPFRLLAPLVLHEGDAHVGDGDGYTAEAQAILRHGASLVIDFKL